MTQTGELNVDFTSSSFKDATNTGFLGSFKETVPARFDITFPKQFPSAPVVFLSITGVLSDYAQQLINFVVDAVDITPTAFTIQLTPMTKNNISGAIISWLATDA